MREARRKNIRRKKKEENNGSLGSHKEKSSAQLW